LVAFIVGLIFFLALMLTYVSNKDERDRYNHLERKRRYSGKRLPTDELLEWEKLARKYKW
jgi:hypothetical protein